MNYQKLRTLVEAKIKADVPEVKFTWEGRFRNGSGATGIRFKWNKLKAEAPGYKTKVFTVYVSPTGAWHTT